MRGYYIKASKQNQQIISKLRTGPVAQRVHQAGGGAVAAAVVQQRGHPWGKRAKARGARGVSAAQTRYQAPWARACQQHGARGFDARQLAQALADGGVITPFARRRREGVALALRRAAFGARAVAAGGLRPVAHQQLACAAGSSARHVSVAAIAEQSGLHVAFRSSARAFGQAAASRPVVQRQPGLRRRRGRLALRARRLRARLRSGMKRAAPLRRRASAPAHARTQAHAAAAAPRVRAATSVPRTPKRGIAA